ncbi:hypothetical protein ACOME3_002586 [Neoechinorhynchus agilis]
MHLGNARTALFNYLFAKTNNGVVFLRFDDTDKSRYDDRSIADILRCTSWLGMKFDRSPIYQSERIPVYNLFVDELLSTGRAYSCFCTPGADPKHEFDDLLYGPIRINPKAAEGDFVLRRSNGIPTYHLACVVDDYLMKISHALNWPIPRYGHLPMLVSSRGKKLKKRHNEDEMDENDVRSLSEYIEIGIDPLSIIHLLTRRGLDEWNAENRTLDDFQRNFSFISQTKHPIRIDHGSIRGIPTLKID